jgi:predicted nucleotidyltransferase
MPNPNKIYEHYTKIPKLFRQYLKDFLTLLKEELNDDLISLILYGSVSRGTSNSESDIDLLLIVSNGFFDQFNEDKISEITINFYNKYQEDNINDKYKSHPVQLLTLSINDLGKFRTLFYDIAVDGIIIYDTNKIGLELLTNYRNRIEKMGLKRIFLDKNDFYWKRKDIKFGEIIEL